MAAGKLPKVPKLLERKIYKTGQTRGADDDAIFQNRVGRNSTVLIPYSVWDLASSPPTGEEAFESGFIALVSPDTYFGHPDIGAELAARGLALGENALVFYDTRDQWNANNPDSLDWSVAVRRPNQPAAGAGLGGQYVARVPANTSEGGERVVRGFNTTAIKGAGIRAYEYASAATNALCRSQLEALFWLCHDSVEVVVDNGMELDDAKIRTEEILRACDEAGLLDRAALTNARILGNGGYSVCPLCLEELSAQGFFNRVKQAQGREVGDLTVTQLNLFHIKELRYGVYGHRPYNVGWGHHHCNVVVKDSGIAETLAWMDTILKKNIEQGHFASAQSGN